MKPVTETINPNDFLSIRDHSDGNRESRILFIGNSYTYYNDGVWFHFQKMAAAADYHVAVDSVTIGGHRLGQFADPNESNPNGGPVVEEKLTNNVYDCVFLQEQSTTPITDFDQFRSSVETLCKRIRRHNKRATVVLYQTWGRESGSVVLDNQGWTNESMTRDLEWAYGRVGQELGISVSPVGTAFYKVYTEHGSVIKLYHTDKTHPSLEGTYLASLVHIGTVLGKEAVNAAVSYTAGIDNGTIEVLKKAALDVLK